TNTSKKHNSKNKDCKPRTIVPYFNASEEKYQGQDLRPDGEYVLQQEFRAPRRVAAQLREHRIGKIDANEINEPRRTKRNKEFAERGFPTHSGGKTQPVLQALARPKPGYHPWQNSAIAAPGQHPEVAKPSSYGIHFANA